MINWEKIKKLTSELVDVPTKNDEITKREIEPNEPRKKYKRTRCYKRRRWERRY